MNHQSFIKTKICTNMAGKYSQNVHGTIILNSLKLETTHMPITNWMEKRNLSIFIQQNSILLYVHSNMSKFHYQHWEKKQTSTRKKNIKWFYLYKIQNQVKLTYDQDSVPTDDDGVKTGQGGTGHAEGHCGTAAAAAAAKSLQSCLTMCDPIPGILQARTRVGCHLLLQCMKVKS